MKAQPQMIKIMCAGHSEGAGNDGGMESVSAAGRLPKMCDPRCGDGGING